MHLLAGLLIYYTLICNCANVDKKLIYKFLRHECSSLEEQEVLNWLQSSDREKLEDYIEEDLNLELTRNNGANQDLGHLLPNILEDTEEEPTKEVDYPIGSYLAFIKSKRILAYSVKWAAAIVLIAGFSFFFNYNLSRVETVQSETSNLLTVKENQRGRKSTIFLKDGSVVYLNSESRISYPEVFSDSQRVVLLEGEAFFEVAKNESKPFIVKTGPIDVKVLGTSFNVRSFMDDHIKISLVSGRVEVVNKNKTEDERTDQIILNPDQSVIYQRNQNTFDEILPFNADQDIGWKDGIIYFHKDGLISVTKRLEKWYDVQFEIMNDPQSLWSYTGKFKNKNLETVLKSISFTQNFTYEIKKDKVIIKFN